MTTTLKEALGTHGMTVAQLSNITEIPKQTLDAYVAGRRKISRAQLDTVLRIAKALDVDPSDLTDPPDRQ